MFLLVTLTIIQSISFSLTYTYTHSLPLFHDLLFNTLLISVDCQNIIKSISLTILSKFTSAVLFLLKFENK